MRSLLRVAAWLTGLAPTAGRLTWLNQAVKFDLFKAGVHPWGLPCVEPVRRAPVKFPKELLVGVTKHPTMWSGYVNVTDRDFLFYWFAEATDDPGGDAPLIVWSNGGPGCSALEGMTTEHGPLLLQGIKEYENSFSGKLSRNPYAWNQRAHVLYVDQPRYVGYSCGVGDFVTSSEDAGKDVVQFLRGWRLTFPEHSERELILATESYGGHYVPAWSSAMLDYNQGASDPFRISGIIIGNGIVNETVQGYSFTEFAKRQGLLPANSSGVTDAQEAREAISQHLGYEPNYYDYRLKEVECCGCSSYNYKPWAEWLLREDVTEALHVCGDAGQKAFGNCAAGCISLPDFDKDDRFDYSGALGRALDAGIRVTLYYGMQDTACNYVGGFAMAASLPWGGAAAFAAAPFEDLVVGAGSTGKVKASGGLTWLQVEGAGHMAPINNPAAAAYAINTLLNSTVAGRRLSKRQLCTGATAAAHRPSQQAPEDEAAAGAVQSPGRLYVEHGRVATLRGLPRLAQAACLCGLAAGLAGLAGGLRRLEDTRKVSVPE